MGASVSKQYLELAGKPILAHTLELFEHHPQVEAVYPIVPSADVDFCQRNIIDRYGFDKVPRLIGGGAQRQDSVANGLKALAEDGFGQPDRPVLVHDGARPLFDTSLLDSFLATVKQQGAAIVAVPAKDTIKVVNDGIITKTLDRSLLWQAQTPQGGRFELLRRAFDEAANVGFYGTDEASLLERGGLNVAVVTGDYSNIKVTTPEDLLIAAALLDSFREKSA